MQHEAIYALYNNVVSIIGVGSDAVAKDNKGNLVSWDATKVSAKQKELQDAWDSVEYQRQRAEEYPDWGTQLDYIYHNGIDKWKTDIVDPVKAKYPKSS